jgi:hypothetical protein
MTKVLNDYMPFQIFVIPNYVLSFQICVIPIIAFSNLCHLELLSSQVFVIPNYCHSETPIPKGQANWVPEAAKFADFFNLGTKQIPLEI